MVTATDVYDYLENYGIDNTHVSSTWIDNRLNNFVVPFIEKNTRQSFTGTQQVTEYYSGTGGELLILNRKPVISIDKIEFVSGLVPNESVDLSSVEAILDQGILKSKTNLSEGHLSRIFARGDRNIKITYTYGYADFPAELDEAALYFTVWRVLDHVANSFGGGNISVQGISKNYGDRGKYTELKNNLYRMGMQLLRPYMTGVVG